MSLMWAGEKVVNSKKGKKYMCFAAVLLKHDWLLIQVPCKRGVDDDITVSPTTSVSNELLKLVEWA